MAVKDWTWENIVPWLGMFILVAFALKGAFGFGFSGAFSWAF